MTCLDKGKMAGLSVKRHISGSLSFVKEYVKEHVVKIRVTVGRSVRWGVGGGRCSRCRSTP